MGNRWVAALVLLAACGGGDDGAPPPPSSSSSTPSTSSSTTSTSAVENEGIGDVELVLPTLLLAASELEGFSDAGFTPGEGACGEPVATAGVRLESPSLAVVEELHGYADVAAATEAFASCASGEPVDVGGDAARRDGDRFVVQVADVVAVVSIEGAGPPDPVEVVAFAAGKVSAYLESAAPGG